MRQTIVILTNALLVCIIAALLFATWLPALVDRYGWDIGNSGIALPAPAGKK